MSRVPVSVFRCGVIAVAALASSSVLLAQTPAARSAVAPRQAPARDPAPPRATPSQAPSRLPVRRVVLYKSGVGYFEHMGPVSGDQAITIDLTTAQLDDVLKSLTTVDLGGGRVSGITFNSTAPLEQRLKTIGLPLGTSTTRAAVLRAVRGSRVAVQRGPTTIVGRVLDVESQTRLRDQAREVIETLQVLTDDGTLHAVDLDERLGVRVLDGAIRGDLGAYLDAIAASTTQDLRRMTLQSTGTGTRDLLVSYVSEVPVWKSTYRLVIPKEGGRRPFLQGWAIVDNALGEDWTHVQLSLVAGAPQSFIQTLSQPLYTRRPVVPVSTTALPTPQTHAAGDRTGTGELAGTVTDSEGAVLPGVQVTAVRAGAVVATTSTDEGGRFSFSPLAEGVVVLTAELPGFSTLRRSVRIAPGVRQSVSLQMRVGGVSETVTVSAEPPDTTDARTATNMTPEEVVAVAAPASREEVTEALAQQTASAQGADLGDLFEYALTQPVTIRRNQSAMVPIVQAEVGAERVSVWNQSDNSARPRRAVWLTNDTGASLDGGAMTLLDEGAFAGEGLIDPIKPKERRLVSFAVDLAARVTFSNDGGPRVTSRVQFARGMFRQFVDERQQATYTLRNDDDAPRTFVIEHPRRPGWQLAPSTTAPDESTADLHRFRVVVPPGASQTFSVAEARPLEVTLALSSITDEHIALVLRGRAISPEQEAQLRGIVAQQAKVAHSVSAIRERQQEISRIDADQRRVRENLEALEGTAAEKALVERYARQLASQEDRLEVLRREIEAETRTQTALRVELMRLVEAVSIDVTMP